MRCIYIKQYRPGVLIQTPFGAVKSNKDGEWLSEPIINDLLIRNYQLFEVEPNENTGMGPIVASPTVDMNAVHEVGSMRPIGYTEPALDPGTRITEARVAGAEAGRIANVPPQRREAFGRPVTAAHMGDPTSMPDAPVSPTVPVAGSGGKGGKA